MIKSSSLRHLAAIVIALLVSIALFACAEEVTTDDSAVTDTVRTATPTPAINTLNGVTTVTVHLSPTEGDGQTGTATFESDGSKTTVEISISPQFAEAQPIHIHAGICTDVGTVLHALQNVVKGTSTTVIDLPIEEIMTSDALVNVHASYTDASTYTACGQIPTEFPDS